MKRIVTAFGSIIAFFIIACEDQIKNTSGENSPEEYMVFGNFHGHCLPCENTMYKVTRSELTFDQMEQFPRLDYQFAKDGEKSQSDFNNSVQLLDLLPQTLKQTDKEVFGCPDCADQGGYYLEFVINGKVKKILLDSSDSDDQSQEVVNFKNAVASIIQVIKG